MGLAVAALALLAAIASGSAFAAGGSTSTIADLAISGSASTGSPEAGAAYSYSFLVKNSGNGAAASSTLAAALPAGAVPGVATVNGLSGQCAASGQTVTCALGTIAASGSVKVVVNATAPTVPGTYAAVTTVATTSVETVVSNNYLTISIGVKAPNTGKVVCQPLATSTASSGYVPGAMVLTAAYSLDPCTSRGTVTVNVVNTATGATEYSAIDPATDITTGLNTLTFMMPAFSTAYRVDFVVTDKKNGGLYQTASATTTTPDAVANCATITKNNLTSGYWLVYAAIWESYTAVNCGYGRQHVELRITNVATGTVVYDAGSWGMDGLLDYEGAVVQYSTEYQFDVEVRGAFGELLDAQSQRIWSEPLR